MYEIKKNVPLPPEVAKRGRKPSFPFAQMAEGDCFDVHVAEGDTVASTRTRLYSAISQYRSRTNSSMRFLVRVVERDGIEFLRIWAQAGEPPKRRATDEFGLPRA